MKLKTLEGTDTRPTSERTKEAVFSAIQFEIHDRKVLDLFGGSGQMALEALSRGAEKAVIVDNSRAACEIIKENASKTGLMKQCRVVFSDWNEYLRGVSGREKFSLVFLDPPYEEGIIDKVFKKLRDCDVLDRDAIVIAETGREGVPEPVEGYNHKIYRYGKSYISIIRNAESGD